MESVDKVYDNFVPMDSSSVEYHQLQPPSSLSNDTPTTSTNKSTSDAPTKGTRNTNNPPIDNIATSSSSSNNSNTQEQYNSMQNVALSSNGETSNSNNNNNQQQLPSSSTEIAGPCDNSSNGIIVTSNDRNPNNDVHLNRVTTSFSESRMIDSNSSGSSSSTNNSIIRSDQIVSQDCNAKKESCPTNFMETTNSNQIGSEINRIEYSTAAATVAAASKECDSSEVIDSDIKDVLPKVNNINDMGHCESSGANLESSTTIKSPAEYSENMRSNSSLVSVSSVCNNGNDNISGNYDGNRDSKISNNNEELNKLEKCASTKTTTMANEVKLSAESNRTKNFNNDNGNNVNLPLDISINSSRESGPMVDRKEKRELSSIIGGSRYSVPSYHHSDKLMNYSKNTDALKMQYSTNTVSKLPVDDRLHDTNCDSSVAVSRSSSLNYKPTHRAEEELSKLYSKQSSRNSYNVNATQHSKEDHRSRADKAFVQTSCTNPISNWVMDSRRFDPLPSKPTSGDKSQLPTESNYYGRYEAHRPYAMPLIEKPSAVDATKSIPPFEAYGYPRTIAESTQINHSSSSIDLSKPSTTKTNSLYVNNPDFSKHHSSSTKDLSPLRMKPPDFSKASTQQSHSDHQNSPSTVIKNYNHTTGNYGVNASNFAEISKKYNYISDLQLKNPAKLPVGQSSPMPMPSDVSKSQYSSLYVRAPDFQKSSKSDKIPKSHSQVLLPHDEPTAHIIHKNQFLNNLSKVVPDPVSLYKNYPQISQDVTMSIVAPHHQQQYHESGAMQSREKYSNAAANDARLKCPETNSKSEYGHPHTSYEEYVLQKNRHANIENDKYREHYYRTENQHVDQQQQHPSIRFMNESANYKPTIQDKQFPLNDSRMHSSQQKQSSRSDYGYPDLNKSDPKYEKSETSHRYSSFNQYAASQLYQSKIDPQRYSDTSYGSKASAQFSSKQSSSSRMQQSNVPQSIPHAATSSSPSAKNLRSPVTHSKPTDYTGQMNPPQNWPSQPPMTSRISQSPISLSSSPISQNTGNRISQSPIGASPSPHTFGGISQSPNYMYASPHATPSPSQLTSSSSTAPSPVHFKHSPSPYYMLPPNQQSPAPNQQYYQAETNNRYSALYPKTEHNYNPMVQIKTEPVSRDYYPTSMTDRSAQMKKMSSDYIDLTKTPKPETYSASTRNLDCCNKYPVSTNAHINIRNEFVNHRAESAAHRTETSTHRTDYPMHEPTAHRTDPVAHRIESMINRPDVMTQRNENLLHRSEPMLHRMDQTNQKHSSDGKSDRPNYNQPKTIMDPYLYRHASEADLNYQIIKKTLGDIPIRRSDTDLSRNIFDSPRSNAAHPKSTSMYQSTTNLQPNDHSYKISTDHQSPFAVSAAEVFLQRNPDVKVIQKPDAPKNPSRMMSKMNEPSPPKTNHSHEAFARPSGELSKHDLSVTVSRISATMSKPTHRQQSEKNEPHSSNYNLSATKVTKSKTENAASLPKHHSSPSSTTVSSSKSVFVPVKRESPLDLSVKTVKTIADSTGCDDYGQCSTSRRRDTHISPSLKIDFSPNFQKHAQTQDYRKPTGHSETQPQVLEVAQTQSPYLQHNPQQASRSERVPPASNSGVYDKRSDIRYLDPDERLSSDSKPYPNQYPNDARKSLTFTPSVPTVFGQKPEELKNLPINDTYCEPSFDNLHKMNQVTALKPKDEPYNQNTVNHHNAKENPLKYVSDPVYKADNRVEPNKKADSLYAHQPRSDSRYADPYYDYRDRKPVSNYYPNPYAEVQKNVFPPQSRSQEELRDSRPTHQSLEDHNVSRKRQSESHPSEQYVPSKKSRYEEPRNYPNNYGYYMPPIESKYFPPSGQQPQVQQPKRDHPSPKVDQSDQQLKDKEADIKVPVSGSVSDTSKYYHLDQIPPSAKASQENQRRPDNYYPSHPMNDRSYEVQFQHQNSVTHSNKTDSKLYYPEAKKQPGSAGPVVPIDQYDATTQQDTSKLIKDTRHNAESLPFGKPAHPEYQYNPYYFGHSERNYPPSKSHQDMQSYQQWRAQTMTPSTSDYYNRMQFHPRPMMPSQPYSRLPAEYPDFKNTSDINLTPVSDASKSQSRAYPPESQQRPNATLKGADQNVISKLRTNLEMKEIEKQKLLKTQNSTETMREDDDPSKNDIASLIAARIRTKGELKGFTPISTTFETKPLPEDAAEENITIPAETAASSVEQCSDLESSTALDLMDWGSACNDFVEQLQSGGTKKRRRRKVRTKSSTCDPKLETVEQEYALENLPGIAYQCDDESLVNIVKAENKGIAELDEMVSKKNDESSSDEDMPLHILRQQSLNESAKIKEECPDDGGAPPPPPPPQAELDIKKEPLEESVNVKMETQVVKNENCDKSDSSSQTGQPSQKVLENVPRNKKEKQREKREQEKKMTISSSSDSEAEANRPIKRMKKVTRKLRSRASVEMRPSSGDESSDREISIKKEKRKKVDSSSSDADQIRSPRKSARRQFSSQERSGKKSVRQSSDGDSSANEDNRDDQKTPAKAKSNILKAEETMTRSKRKRELENQIANSKILRNDKVVKNVITPDRKTGDSRKSSDKGISKSSSEKSKSSSKSSSKTEDHKRKILDSDNEASTKPASLKKKSVRATKLQTSSSENEQSGAEEMLAERLRSRKIKPSTEPSITPEKEKKWSRTPKKAATPSKPPAKTETFPPGWEEQVYEYKRSLKVPASLITIGRPPIHRKSVSLPDLDPHSSDASETFAENKRQIQLKEKEQLKKGKAGIAKLPEKIEVEDNTKLKSIIDVLHQRVIRPVKNNRQKARPVSTAPKMLPQSNEVELLSTPGAEGVDVFKHHSVFETAVLKSRTRKEYRAQKNQEIIREVFGCDDRPASAPPEPTALATKENETKPEPVTFDQKYKQYLEKMNIDFGEKIRKLKNVNKPVNTAGESQNTTTITTTTTTTIVSVPEKLDEDSILNQDDETQDTEINECERMADDIKEEPMDLNERDTPSALSERDGMTPNSMKSFKAKKGRGNRSSRRKGSSGFDYIRKKKKPLTQSTNSNGLSTVVKRREAAVNYLQEKDENDINREIRGWVLNKGVGESVLHKAARLGYVDVIAFCLERMEMPPDQKDNAGYTPLHEACSRGRIDIARLLLKYGAHHSETAHSGIRPLHEATENGYIEIVRLLLSYGADPLLATYSGQTPIMLAENDEKMISFFKNYIQDIQNTGPNKIPWRFEGPWSIYDPDEHGYNIFVTDGLVEEEFKLTKSNVLPAIVDDIERLKNHSKPSTIDTCDSNSNIMYPEIQTIYKKTTENDLHPDTIKSKYKTCTVVLNNIDSIDRIAAKVIPKQDQSNSSNLIAAATTSSIKIEKGKETSKELGDEGGGGGDAAAAAGDSDTDGDLFEFEESEMPHVPLYHLRDEGVVKWAMLNDICYLLKVKSKDTLLKQISSGNPSSSPNNKELLRELKMTDFLEKATCLQLLCSGEKLNIRSSKVILIKYNESVKNLLGVKTVLMKF